MNTNLYEILKNVDQIHRVKFTGWEMDFRDTDWPTMMEFSVKTTSVDASTNTNCFDFMIVYWSLHLNNVNVQSKSLRTFCCTL